MIEASGQEFNGKVMKNQEGPIKTEVVGKFDGLRSHETLQMALGT